MRLSVIIPTLNEASTVSECVRYVVDRASRRPEVIVADCGSTDVTRSIAERLDNVNVIRCKRGSRSAACNAGAAAARGEALLFVHADSIVPPDYDRIIERILEARDVVGGAFEFRLGGCELRLRFVEAVNRFRYRASRRFFGDQGIFLRRHVFDRIGGFPDTPLLEDCLLCEAAGRLGKLSLSRAEMITSPRRFYNGGILRTLIADGLILLAYRFGFDLEKLGNWYRRDNRRRGVGGIGRERERTAPVCQSGRRPIETWHARRRDDQSQTVGRTT